MKNATSTTAPLDLSRNGPEHVRAELRAFGEHYDYDASYLERLMDAAPGAFARFAAAMAMARPHEVLPADAASVAKAAVLLHDDCGPCLQLGLRMAVEAGVGRDVLNAALHSPAKLPQPLRDVYDHARQVVGGENGDPERIERLRAALGTQGFAELAVAIVGARIYPTLKHALGEGAACVPADLAL